MSFGKVRSKFGLDWRFGIDLLAGVVAIATVLGFFSSIWWGFSFLDYPRPQYCLVLVIALSVGLLSRQRWLVKRWKLLWCIPLLINLCLVDPDLLDLQSSRQHAGVDRILDLGRRPNHLRVLHLTLDRDNPELSQAIAYINHEQAQLVSVLEVTPDSLPQLKAKLTGYQLVGAEPRTNSHGSAWFLRQSASQPITVVGTEVIHLPANSDRPLLKATINYGKKTIHLLCFHAIRPQNAGSVTFQQVEFAALSAWSQSVAKENKNQVIVIGDFNSPQWSVPFRAALKDSGLRNSLTGFGWQPTWPSGLPAFARIPIDHCLHSRTFFTSDRHIGPNVGSDHLPLFVELRF
jgi:endonuclease/exonuclease/phosphatase (EEP) superfamily protein YafD